MPQSGTKLGRYFIIEPLGSGGMGVVYRARDEKLERIVAIKILAPGLLRGEDARRRFNKEALALAKLSSSHIAAVYDVGEQDGIDYIVMECVPGESLSAKLSSGPLTVKDATSITLQIAEALEEAHEQGVIHRDLKPGNVMVTPKGQVKVLDFGLAKLLEVQGADETVSLETRGIIGTPLYMSPEQVHGEKLDTRTDLWSLGVVYYESLTGRRPFDADSTIGILHSIAEKTPLPLREIRTDAPPLAEQIVRRTLEKNPASRYQSASEVVGTHRIFWLPSVLGRWNWRRRRRVNPGQSWFVPRSLFSSLWRVVFGFTVTFRTGVGPAKRQFRRLRTSLQTGSRLLPSTSWKKLSTIRPPIQR